MLPGIEMMACQDMAVPMDVMKHVVHVESSNNPFAIGVVGGRLVRQPAALDEALATVRMLEEKGYNFSVGLAQVNRYNLSKYGLASYEQAFKACPNLQAGSKILAECYSRSGNDWGKSFSCYYSGNFVTGYRHGYVQKIYASIDNERRAAGVAPIAVVGERTSTRKSVHDGAASRINARVIDEATEAPAQVAAADPARTFPVRTSASAQLRADAIGVADSVVAQALGKRVMPGRTLSAEPATLAVNAPIADAAGNGSAAGNSVSSMPMPERPVMLRAWNDANKPQPAAAGVSNATAAVVGTGDAAFVF